MFTGLDPVENLNRYQYVAANPTNLIDPSGLSYNDPLLDQYMCESGPPESPCIRHFCSRYDRPDIAGHFREWHEDCVSHYRRYPNDCDPEREVDRFLGRSYTEGDPFGRNTNLAFRNLAILADDVGVHIFANLALENYEAVSCQIGPAIVGGDSDSVIIGFDAVPDWGVGDLPSCTLMRSDQSDGFQLFLSAGGCGMGTGCSLTINPSSREISGGCERITVHGFPTIDIGIVAVIPAESFDVLVPQPNIWLGPEGANHTIMPPILEPFYMVCLAFGGCDD